VGIAFFLLFGAEPLRRHLHTGKVVTDAEEGKRPATLALLYGVRRAERPPEGRGAGGRARVCNESRRGAEARAAAARSGPVRVVPRARQRG